MIAFACPNCQKRLQIEPVHAGKSVRCPGCQQSSRVPNPTLAAVPHSGFPTARPSAPVRELSEHVALLPSPPADDAATLPPPAVPATLSPPASPRTAAAPPTPSASRATAAGVPGYETLEELGRGGMGVVYKARQIGLNRLCALKMILAGGHAGEADLARFRTEAEAIARLQHPNIVAVHEIGTHEGKPYFSLEFCAGGSLDRKLNGTPIEPREAAKLVKTLADAMQAAHEAKVIHRDLKPANVLLSGDGTAKITDFGLAKKLDDVGQTQSGAIMGTPSYMAPEQAGGKIKELGPACDIYGLGAILYELLTGRPPFKAATPLDTILQVVTLEPVPPRQLQPSTPRDLETICLKCLHKEPQKRYATAEELAADLRRYQAGEPIRARPVGVVGRGVRWVRRNPAVAGLLAATAAALVLGAATASAFAVRANASADRAAAERQRAEEEKARASQKAEEATEERRRAEANARRVGEEKQVSDRRLYVADMRLAQRAWEENDLGRLAGLLEGQKSARAGDEDLRGFEWHYWRRRIHGELRAFAGHAGAVTSVAVAAQGDRLASAGEDGTIRVWNVRTGLPECVFKRRPGSGSGIALSRDGERLAAGDEEGRRVRVWNVTTGREVHSLAGHKHPIRCVAFHPDGQRLASGGGVGAPVSKKEGKAEVKLWRLTDGREERSFGGCRQPVLSVAFSPDGKRLAGGGGNPGHPGDPGEVNVWDVASGERERTLATRSGKVTCLAFSPDGLRLAGGTYGQQVRVWDAASGQDVHTLNHPMQTINGLAFQPDGKHLAVAAGRLYDQDGLGALTLWDAGTGRLAFAVRAHAGSCNDVAFTADGKRLASAGKDSLVKLWDAEVGLQEAAFTVHPGRLTAMAVSLDGKRIATAGGRMGNPAGEVKVWDAVTRRETASLAGLAGWPHAVAFRPDGRRLATGTWAGTVAIWDAATGQAGVVLPGCRQPVMSVAFSPDGKRLAAGAFGEVKVWGADGAQEVFTLAGHSHYVKAAFSPDGKHIVTGGGQQNAPGELKVWDAASGKAVFSLEGHMGFIHGMAFSRDGRLLASAGGDKTVRVWDVAAGKEVFTLRGHTDPVLCAAFSPDGRRLASGSGSLIGGEVKVWDVVMRQEILSLKEKMMAIWKVDFSPDGRRLIAGSGDGRVKIWDAAPLEKSGVAP